MRGLVRGNFGHVSRAILQTRFSSCWHGCDPARTSTQQLTFHFLPTVQIDRLARGSAGRTARAVAPDAANSGSSGQVASSSNHDSKRTQGKGVHSCSMHQMMVSSLVTGRKLIQTQLRPLANLLGLRLMAVVTTTTAAAMTIVLLMIGLPRSSLEAPAPHLRPACELRRTGQFRRDDW